MGRLLAASDPKKSLNSFVRLLLFKYAVATKAQVEDSDRQLTAQRILDELKLYAPAAASSLEAAWADHVRGTKRIPIQQVTIEELRAHMEWNEAAHSVYRQVPADETPEQPSHSVENPQAPVGYGQQMKVPTRSQPGDAWGSGPDALGPVSDDSSASGGGGEHGSDSGSARLLESELDGLRQAYGQVFRPVTSERQGGAVAGSASPVPVALESQPNWGLQDRGDRPRGQQQP